MGRKLSQCRTEGVSGEEGDGGMEMKREPGGGKQSPFSEAMRACFPQGPLGVYGIKARNLQNRVVNVSVGSLPPVSSAQSGPCLGGGLALPH